MKILLIKIIINSFTKSYWIFTKLKNLPNHTGFLPNHTEFLPNHTGFLPHHTGFLPNFFEKNYQILLDFYQISLIFLPNYTEFLPNHTGFLPN